MSWEQDLADLPRPEPPPDLTAIVLARIARIDEAAPAPATAPAPAVWPAWVTALGALAAAFAVVVSSKDPVIWGFVLVTSLVIYLTGLFGMVSNRRARSVIGHR